MPLADPVHTLSRSGPFLKSIGLMMSVLTDKTGWCCDVGSRWFRTVDDFYTCVFPIAKQQSPSFQRVVLCGTLSDPVQYLQSKNYVYAHPGQSGTLGGVFGLTCLPRSESIINVLSVCLRTPCIHSWICCAVSDAAAVPAYGP